MRQLPTTVELQGPATFHMTWTMNNGYSPVEPSLCSFVCLERVFLFFFFFLFYSLMETCHSEGFLKEAHCDLTNVDLFDATDQTFALETDILERTIQLYNRKKL